MPATNRVALVTGSASGVGSAIAKTLAGAGYDVIVNYSRSEAAAQETTAACNAAGSDTLLVRCDVSDESEVTAMVEAIDRKFGRLDVVCNNAGTSIETLAADFEQVTVEEFDRVLAVNVRGLFLVAKHTKALLERSRDACMVNTASIVGMRPGPQPLPYSASKAATIAMTQTLAFALGPAVRVNAVAPGWIEGDWMQRMLGDNYDRLMERRARMTPLKRCVNPDDVAEVVLSMIEHMHFVTGETVVIDGGYAKTT